MKKINYKYLALLILFFNIYACEKDLNLLPLDQVSEEVFFKETNDFKLFANSFYNSFPSPSALWSSDMQSEIFGSSPNLGGGLNSVSNGSYLPSEYDDNWNNNYDLIRNTSYLLSNLENATESLKNTSNIFGAEAHFFRAYAYYNLLKAYGGVPLITKVLTLEDEELYSGKASRLEVANQIIADLDKAIADLPKKSELSAADDGRITNGAALALKSRVALFEGTWQKFHNGEDATDFLGKSIEAARQVINSSEYQLWDKRDQLGEQSYRHLFLLDSKQTNIANFTKADNKEYILSNRFDIDFRPNNTIVYPNATRKFADLFLCTDGLPIDKSPLFMGRDSVTTEYRNRDSRMRTLFQIVDQRYWDMQQPPWHRHWDRPYDPSTGFLFQAEFGIRTLGGYNFIKFNIEVARNNGPDWPIIRYAEVLLNYAEAVLEKNGTISDEDLDISINRVKERVGLPRLTNSFVSGNGLDMREEIRRERSIELAAEGFRYDDLRRWKTAEVEMPKSMRGIKYKGTQWETDPRWAGLDASFDAEGNLILEDASKRQFGPNKHYLKPLPRRELILNPNLEQNPGW